VPAVA